MNKLTNIIFGAAMVFSLVLGASNTVLARNCEVPYVDAGPDQEIVEGTTARLEASINDGDDDYDAGGIEYSWRCDGGSLSNDGTLNPSFKVVDYEYDDRVYNCTIEAQNGCGSDSDSVQITVTSDSDVYPVVTEEETYYEPDGNNYEEVQDATMVSTGFSDTPWGSTVAALPVAILAAGITLRKKIAEIIGSIRK